MFWLKFICIMHKLLNQIYDLFNAISNVNAIPLQAQTKERRGF